MGITKHLIRRYIGQHVQCHTLYGTFQGVIMHCGKQHVILAAVPMRQTEFEPMMRPFFGYGPPGGPPPMGPPGGPPGPPGPGGGWHLAIPLAAIIGVTALGMHWW